MATISTPPLYPSPAPKPQGWLQRHWILAIFLAFAALALLAMVFVGGLLALVEGSFKKSDAYSAALAKARTNPQVLAKLGEPIADGWFSSGNINVSGPSGHADIAIPISGPKSKGTIYVVATKSAGRWHFDTLEVEIDGESQRIDLLVE